MVAKLDAVNDVMRRCGKLTVTSLDTDGNSTESHVERALDDAATRVMSKGWRWNIKYDVKVQPDGDDKVKVSELEAKGGGGYYTIYHVDTYGNSSTLKVIRVGEYLYDLGENQDTFDESDVYLTYVYERDFTEIPDPFANWIIAEAAFSFNRQFVGNKMTDQALQVELSQRQSEAMREEIRAADVNVLEESGVKQILGRPRTRDRSVY